ncbi:GapS4a family protein [Niabella hirudinis]|uniref:GapS4a family protein n=1 Tax=Niabella hirudinis TaxID=1285929 RepID=UPI003EBB6A81
MGEWSKSIGEKGENIVQFIFENILNFNSLLQNESINCIKGLKHKDKDSQSNKSSHGIDGLISYKNPLEDYTIDIGLISSKYVGGEYTKYPTTLFKSHIKDLAYSLECFNNSKLKNSINQNFIGVNKTEIFGILVWLSNTSDLKFDLISKVNNIQIDSDLVFDKIILLDNNKVNFLYESIHRTKEVFGGNNVDFVYHNSGLNFTSLQESSFGKIFPLNYLYSDIIALRTERDNIISLSIFINDDFEEEQFVQILNFAKSFDHLNAVNKVILNYKAYDYLNNENLVKEKLVKFPMYKIDQNLEIKKFPSDFRN